MIQAWLARKTGMIQTMERLAVLERELSDAKSTIAALTDRLATAEAHGAAATTANGRLDRQVRVLVRAVRAGTARLRRLSSTDMDHTASGEALEKEVGRLSAAILIVENKLETEAELMRRGMTGLLRQMKAGRPEVQVDPAG